MKTSKIMKICWVLVMFALVMFLDLRFNMNGWETFLVCMAVGAANFFGYIEGKSKDD